MKTCPCCGYEDNLTNRQLNARFKKLFGGFPVLAMIKRQWIRVGNYSHPSATKDMPFIAESDMPQIKTEMMRFLECETEAEFNEFIKEHG